MYIIVAKPQFRMFEQHWIVRALALALASAGSSSAARMAMIAITTSSSISVNPPSPRPGIRLERLFITFSYCVKPPSASQMTSPARHRARQVTSSDSSYCRKRRKEFHFGAIALAQSTSVEVPAGRQLETPYVVSYSRSTALPRRLCHWPCPHPHNPTLDFRLQTLVSCTYAKPARQIPRCDDRPPAFARLAPLRRRRRAHCRSSSFRSGTLHRGWGRCYRPGEQPRSALHQAALAAARDRSDDQHCSRATQPLSGPHRPSDARSRQRNRAGDRSCRRPRLPPRRRLRLCSRRRSRPDRRLRRQVAAPAQRARLRTDQNLWRREEETLLPFLDRRPGHPRRGQAGRILSRGRRYRDRSAHY